MRRLLGELSGKRVLDLACGFGYYTRLVRGLGAGSATGVDVSSEMVALARAAEDDQPLGIDYHVYDIADLPRLGSYDIATAVWLFNYASSPLDMVRMFSAIRHNLAPGGRLVAITIDPDYNPDGPSWESYGLRILAAESHKLRTGLTMELLTKPPSTVTYSRWDREVYDAAYREAGFSSLSWRPIHIPASVIQSKGDAYWATYRENPFVAALECW